MCSTCYYIKRTGDIVWVRFLAHKMSGVSCFSTSHVVLPTMTFPPYTLARIRMGGKNNTELVKREKTNKIQQSDVYYQRLSQHVSGIIMPIFRRAKALLLHVVYWSGSAGCGW